MNWKNGQNEQKETLSYVPLYLVFALILFSLAIGILALSLSSKKTGSEEEDGRTRQEESGENAIETSTSDTTPTDPDDLKEDTLPPETEEAVGSEAPFETEAPSETETPSGTAQNQTSPPVVAPTVGPPRQYGSIRSLSQEEINHIRNSFSQSHIGFGVGLGHADAASRSPQADAVLRNLAPTGAKVVCYCGEAGEKKVAFSFQAGYLSGYEGQILDILKAKNVTGTFYFGSTALKRDPALIERLIAEGHRLGGHSWSLPSNGIESLPLEEEMEDALTLQAYVKEHYGYDVLRYNYMSGSYSLASAKLFSEMGFQQDFCSANFDDYWTDGSEKHTLEEALSGLKNMLHDGCIYCFHMTNRQTTEFLGPLIDYCREMGYTVVAVP